MLDGLGLIELNKTRTRHRMDRISGRIGDEVQMKPRQSQNATAANKPRASLWVNRRKPSKSSRLIPGLRSLPRIRRIDAAIINRKRLSSPFLADREDLADCFGYPPFIRNRTDSTHLTTLPIVSLPTSRRKPCATFAKPG
jgi:hypothetical protein